jgi:hypothetical protein
MKKTLRQKRIKRFNKLTGLGTYIMASTYPNSRVDVIMLRSLLKARELYLKAFRN